MEKKNDDVTIDRFYTRGRIIRLDELGPIFVIRLVKDGHRTHYPSRQLSFEVRRSRRITKDSSSRRILRLVPYITTKLYVCLFVWSLEDVRYANRKCMDELENMKTNVH